MKEGFNRDEVLKEIKEKMLENGFIISENRERDRALNITRKHRPEIKEKL